MYVEYKTGGAAELPRSENYIEFNGFYSNYIHIYLSEVFTGMGVI